MSDWIRGTVEAIGWPLLQRLECADREDVPDEMVVFASNRNWRFEVAVKFTAVEEMSDTELDELFGLVP